MRKTSTIAIAAGLAAMLACGTVTTSPDIQATVDAAVAATATAQIAMQATIDAAVAATYAAAPSATPIEIDEEPSEEELAALIDEAVAGASTAAEEASAATAEAASDDTITQAEVDEMEAAVSQAEEAITYAEELISLYDDLYGELAAETLDLLIAIEEDLELMADDIAAINDLLLEAGIALEQGIEMTEEVLAELDTAAQAVSTKASEIRGQNQALAQTLQTEIANRVASILAIQPTAIASSRQEAIQSALEYAGGVRQSLEDRRVSQSELADIAQLGANAVASLNAQGGPQLQQLAGNIGDLTTQIARGQVPQASAALGNLEAALNALPSLP